MAGIPNRDNPAYPVVDPRAPAADFPWVCGLTKREAFALAALQGILANPFYAEQASGGECSGSPASAALFHADELLTALDTPATGGHR